MLNIFKRKIEANEVLRFFGDNFINILKGLNEYIDNSNLEAEIKAIDRDELNFCFCVLYCLSFSKTNQEILRLESSSVSDGAGWQLVGTSIQVDISNKFHYKNLGQIGDEYFVINNIYDNNINSKENPIWHVGSYNRKLCIGINIIKKMAYPL